MLDQSARLQSAACGLFPRLLLIVPSLGAVVQSSCCEESERCCGETAMSQHALGLLVPYALLAHIAHELILNLCGLASAFAYIRKYTFAGHSAPK